MRPRRLERLTYGLGNRRSIHLSYGRIEYSKYFTNAEMLLPNITGYEYQQTPFPPWKVSNRIKL